MDIEKLNKVELEALQMVKEREYQLCLQSLNEVELRDDELSLKATELQADRKRLKTALTQGKYNVRHLQSEMRIIKTMIWKRLGEGQ